MTTLWRTINGHEFTPENTKRSRGRRYCVTCKRERGRITDQKRRPRARATNQGDAA